VFVRYFNALVLACCIAACVLVSLNDLCVLSVRIHLVPLVCVLPPPPPPIPFFHPRCLSDEQFPSEQHLQAAVANHKPRTQYLFSFQLSFRVRSNIETGYEDKLPEGILN